MFNTTIPQTDIDTNCSKLTIPQMAMLLKEMAATHEITLNIVQAKQIIDTNANKLTNLLIFCHFFATFVKNNKPKPNN